MRQSKQRRPGSAIAPGGDGGGPPVPEGSPRSGLAALARVLSGWEARADPAPLLRWLDRELDAEGVPRHLAPGDWAGCLGALAGALGRRPEGWPDAADARSEGLLRAVLRFSRPDGSVVFGTGRAPAGQADLLHFWADRLADPALSSVVHRWFPRSGSDRRAKAPPPLPADSRPDRPLAMLRPDWSSRGDFLAIDQRDRDSACRLELFGLGRRWLGPDWGSGPRPDTPSESTGPARPTAWITGPYADLAEWTFRRGTARVTRTALLLRGRQLALLADQVDGHESWPAVRIAIAPDAEATSIPESRALKLTSASTSRAPSARVLPLGLSTLPYPTDRGSFVAEGRDLLLRQANPGRHCWLPLLVSWSPLRDRRPIRWRLLTVSERSKACPADVAFAVRVAWGTDESLVIYRSLARPALRAFLGHQTGARFLVGLFTKSGVVKPLLQVEP